MKTRIVTRVIVFQEGRILLSRNEGAKHWYPGGGGLEENESLEECASREVLEETGQSVDILNIIYVQEFYVNDDERFLEIFFLARPKKNSSFNQFHKDEDENNRVKIEENRWFTQDELEAVTVYPEFMRQQFWEDIKSHDPDKKNYYLGKMKI